MKTFPTVIYWFLIIFLFKVVESTYPFDKEFRDTCANEIKELMTPVQEKKEDKESE